MIIAKLELIYFIMFQVLFLFFSTRWFGAQSLQHLWYKTARARSKLNNRQRKAKVWYPKLLYKRFFYKVIKNKTVSNNGTRPYKRCG